MDSKNRFTSRVDNYVKYRPGYPSGIIEKMKSECSLSVKSIVADIGSGTGLLSTLFLEMGCRVYGIEPNTEMRVAGEHQLAKFPTFVSVPGSAEDIGLPDNSVDFVTAGQAFHWFNPILARAEFMRILRPEGWVILIWNERQLDTTPFLIDYDYLLQKYALDYNQVDHRRVEENPNTIPAFYGGKYQLACFKNVQVFDYTGVEGRMLSSSYVPEVSHPTYQNMLEELRSIFDRHQHNGKVEFIYNTRMFYGRFM